MARDESVTREAYEDLMGHIVCERCGGDNRVEWHHREPRGSGDDAVSHLVVVGSSVKRFKKELAKCDALCRSCHMKEDGRLERLHKNKPLQRGKTYIPEVRICKTCGNGYSGYTRKGDCTKCADRRRNRG